jgi:hypothetical protein
MIFLTRTSPLITSVAYGNLGLLGHWEWALGRFCCGALLHCRWRMPITNALITVSHKDAHA